MAKPTGFLEFTRDEPEKRPVVERVRDWHEVEIFGAPDDFRDQAARCLDCGIPFCHTYGCPLGNLVPDFNDMVYRGRWRTALDLLHERNNFPEITGRVCPAPCEAACTLSEGFGAVNIRRIECLIAERGFKEGWIVPIKAARESGKRVAVLGSGPAGLAAAQQLARAGHRVSVFEKSPQPGGLLRYGIPDFKLEKKIIDRRLRQIVAEGVSFQVGVEAGTDVSARYLRRSHDAVLIATGAGVPRDLDIAGRDLAGIHFAMDFLVPMNAALARGRLSPPPECSARGKKVVVIGGGDTGSDCVGTALRQGAASVVQLELLPRPAEGREPGNPWPQWPRILRTSTSQEEGGERLWAVETMRFTGKGGKVAGLEAVRLDWSSGKPERIGDSAFPLEADLVLLALGFVHAEHGRLLGDLGIATDERGNILLGPDGATSADWVFAAGDAAAGASLVVRAIASGRAAAEAVDSYLS
ncbi:MAG TPA: glutamate synthase subunit beta [bacterium]|nr:glutamate synthase subunit beta [bacterium]HPQ66123.1 glutamate synthase subunit beta [bacterium]